MSALEIAVRPRFAYRMPRGGGEDGVMRIAGGVAHRLLHVDARPVLVRAWQAEPRRVLFRAEPVDPRAISAAPPRGPKTEAGPPAEPEQLERALARMRFALAVDDDLAEFHRRFRSDPLLAPLLRRLPHFRPARRPWPWEALAWAVVKQLIETGEAATIQRRIVGRWGARLGGGRGALRDVPGPALLAGRAPAEIESMGLSGRRAIALRAVAGLAASGRCDLMPGSDRRLLRVPSIGPWTIQCLGLHGRGEADSLPAGDLAYIKLVGRLAALGRRATVAEVEEFYRPYAPYRGLAGALTVAGLHHTVAQGPPLRRAA